MLCAVCKTDLVYIGTLRTENSRAEGGWLLVTLYACPQCKRVYANI